MLFLTEANFVLLGSVLGMWILHIGKYMYELHKVKLQSVGEGVPH